MQMLLLKRGARRVSRFLHRHHELDGLTPGDFIHAQRVIVNARRVLAVASGGGHWVQLQRMMSAFNSHNVAFVTTLPSHRSDAGSRRFYVVTDANRHSRCKMIRMVFQMLWIVLRERPHVVISTGAAPGYFAMRFAKLIGARTIWVDSIANVEQLSMSGQRVGAYADLWLTQWPHLARNEGPYYAGAVL